MKAWIVGDSPNAGLTLVRDAPKPRPGPGEVLIHVQSVGVTPAELSWYPTRNNQDGTPRRQVIPCHEFAGTIVDLGEGVTAMTGGEEVFGMNDWYAQGALTEYCIALPRHLAHKPRTLSFAEAASVPISALTAWQGLIGRAGLQAGDKVLIHGGSGAVGTYAVQFARLQQARVITTASERNREFLLQLGADQVIDYHTQDFTKLVERADVIFDTVGGETLRRSWNLLAPHGRMVTVSSESADAQDERTKKAFFIVEPDGEQLARIARQIEAGSLQTVVDAIIPCLQADIAFTGKVTPRLGRGKVVVLGEAVHWDLDSP